MKRTLLVVALLAAADAATAQTGCSRPVVKVLRNQQEVSNTGAALASQVMLQVSPNPSCGEKVSYQFKDAELTLIRARRPIMPSKRVSQPEVDLSEWASMARPGDGIYVFIPYKNLLVVNANGQRTPYPVSALEADKSGSNFKWEGGISFNWLLVQK